MAQTIYAYMNKQIKKKLNGIVFRNRQIYPKIHMEPQRTLNSQNNLENEEQSWRLHTS
jgi:hypothetical protein